MQKKLLFLASGIFILSGCVSQNIVSENKTIPQLSKQKTQATRSNTQLSKEVEFTGEKGEGILLKDKRVVIDASKLNDGLAHYYNTKLTNGQTVYYFIVKDKNGIYRAAANGCQVCYNARMGFSQVGNYMVCNTCGNKYPLEKIATEKGGCNPGPINPNLKVSDGKITISEKELLEVASLF